MQTEVHLNVAARVSENVFSVKLQKNTSSSVVYCQCKLLTLLFEFFVCIWMSVIASISLTTLVTVCRLGKECDPLLAHSKLIIFHTFIRNW